VPRGVASSIVLEKLCKEFFFRKVTNHRKIEGMQCLSASSENI
jgi:hypothetical protein